jgi:hypothetical protein
MQDPLHQHDPDLLSLRAITYLCANGYLLGVKVIAQIRCVLCGAC